MVLLPILTYGRRVRRLSRASQDRVADLGVYAGEALDAIRTVQAFVHEAADRRHFSARVEAAFQAARQRVAARAMLTAVVMLLVFGAVSIILWIGGHDVLSGRIRDRKSGVSGKRVAVRVDLGGRRLIKKKKKMQTKQ